MIPLALLACASLLIGCGGKTDEKTSHPESEQSSEPGPGPEPGPEEEVVFPKTLDEAGFVNMGEMSFEAPEEFRDASMEPINFEDLQYRSTDIVIIESEHNPFYEGVQTVSEQRYSFESFDNDVCTYQEAYDSYYLYEGFGKAESYSYVESYVYLTEDDTLYCLEEDSSDDYLWYDWDILNGDMDDLIEDFYEEIMSYGQIHSQPAYTKIGNSYYVVCFTLEKEIEYVGTAYGDYVYFCFTTKQETVLKINSDLLVEEIYLYSEVTFDHDAITGEFLDEPYVYERSLVYLENSYGNYRSYQNVPEVPDQYFSYASLAYRVAPVTLGNSGELLAAPEFPSNFSTASDEFFIDYENAGLMFTPAGTGQYLAIEFSDLTLNYLILTGDDMDTYNSVTFNIDDDTLATIAELMGAQLIEYNDVTYFVIDQETVNYLEFDFSTFGVETMEDVTIRKLTVDYYLR